MGQWGSLEVIEIAQRVTSSCSIIGSSIVCALFFYLRWWNSSTHHVILFYISIADILYSTNFMLGPWVLNNHTWCTFQAWLGQMFGLATQMWLTVLGFNLLLQMKYYWKDEKCRRMMRFYHGFVWGIPFVLSILPVIEDIMVPLGTWCWITSREPGWRLTLYIPMWINFGFNLCIITMVIRLLRWLITTVPKDMENSSRVKRHYRFVTCQTLMFVVAGMLCWSMSTIIRVSQAIHDYDIPYEMLFLQATLLPFQGIFNLLVYVAPSLRHNFCCDRGHDKATDSATSPNQGTELSEGISATKEVPTSEDYECTLSSSRLSRTSAFQKFRSMNESMSFFDGPGRQAIDIIRREKLSIKDNSSNSSYWSTLLR